MALAMRQAPWLTQSIGQTTASQPLDHLLDAVQAVVDAAVVVEEQRHARLGCRPQVGHDGRAPADVEYLASGESPWLPGRWGRRCIKWGASHSE